MNAPTSASPRATKARRLRPWLLGALAALVLVLLVVAGGGWWAVRSEQGQRWLLSHVPGLALEGVHGRLDGGPFSVTRLSWSSAGLKVEVEDLAWKNAEWQWHPFDGAWVGLTLKSPSARRVAVAPLPQAKPQRSAQPPADLRLPLALRLSDLRIGALQWAEAPPIRNLAGSIDLGADRARLHTGTLEADITTWHLKADVRAGTDASMALDGHVGAEQTATSTPWRAQANVSGSIREPHLAALLTQGGQDVLQARAALRPFEPQMLSSLQASTSGLDLSGLVPGAPSTRLAGSITARVPAVGQPLEAALAVENAAPGPWDAARLPVQRVHASARIISLTDVRLQSCKAGLYGTRAAGELTCTGQWNDGALTLELQVANVRTDEIHSAAPLMTLSGSVKALLSKGGPDKGVARPAGAQEEASRAASAAPLSGHVEAALTGSLHRLPSGKDRVEVDGRADFHGRRGAAGTIDTWTARIPDLSVKAGAASLQASADVHGDEAGRWQVASRGDMRHFDPSVWWAGPPGARLRDQRHDLNASWKADLTLADRPAGDNVLPQVNGQARLDVSPSILGGVPLSAQAIVDAKRNVLNAQTQSNVGGNKVEADVHWPTGAAQAPRWTASVQAPRLGALSPWREVLPSLSAWIPTGGSLQAQANGEGRFPAMAVSGDLRATDIHSVQWGIAALEATWQAHLLEPRAPLKLTLRARQGHYGSWSTPLLTAETNGSIAAHRLAVSGTVVQTQTASAPKRDGAPLAPRRDTIDLALAGTWQARSGCDGTWRGHINDARARSAAANDPAWLEAHDLDAKVSLGPDCGWQAATLAPGQLKALGATVRWTDAMLRRASDGTPRGRIVAQVMPMAIAPFLARMQPERGWTGDLRLAARASLAFEEQLRGEVVLERTSGDLRLLTDAGPMSLGLEALRVTAASQGRTWHLQEHWAGRAIGRLEGAQALTIIDGPLPSRISPISGQVSLQAPELVTWSTLLPAPWQVRGSLHGQVNVSGKLGSPVLTGDLQGSDLAVRNVLQGINLSDGRLHVTLQGQQAALQQLSFKGGDGLVTATGQASFGPTPRARIDVRAVHLQAVGRLDRTIVVSGQANADFVGDSIRLDGRFNVDRGLIDISTSEAPSLDEDVVLHKGGRIVDVDGRTITAQAEGGNSAVLQHAQVSVWVALGDDLRLRGKGLDTLLKGQLHVTTPGGDLAVNGTVRTEGGRYTAYGQNLVIDRGIIQFNGPVAAPRLDILALRDDVDIRVGVAITGSAADPRVRLYSEPEMSDTDKLSWLVMGRAPEGLGQEDVALLQKAALALVAGQKGKPAGGGLVKRLGLDELSLHQGDSGDLRGTVVSLGKQLSKHWLVRYEQGLNATVGSWQLIYRLARQINFRLSTGAESAVDVVRTWRFD